MEPLRYRSGSWICVARNSFLCLLPPETEATRVQELWALLGTAPSLERVFVAVSGGLGSSLADMPSFGVLARGERLHVLLRGPLELQQHGQPEPAASGTDVTTWSERVLPGTGTFSLRITTPAASGGPGAGALFPLESGTVLVSALELTAIEPAALEPAALEPVALEPVALETAVLEHAAPKTEALESAVLEPAGVVTGGHGAAEPAAAAQAKPSTQTGNQLIDSVPWLRSARADPIPEPAPAPAPLPDPAPAPPAAPAPDAAPAPARAPDPASEPSTTTEDEAGVDLDHDGDTIMGGFLPMATPPQGAEPAPATGPTVLALTCPQGHSNPPTRPDCVLCGQPLGKELVPVARPALGKVVFSTGQVAALDRNFVIGRQPSAARMPGSDMPRMVQVPSPGGEISRSHVEIRLEGWHIKLRDLRSTNGTVLVRDGQLPHRLVQDEAVIVFDGDKAELGDDVWMRFEGLA